MDERLLWILIAAVAFVGIVCMVTVLIVTGRKSRGGSYEEDAYDEIMKPVTAARKQPRAQEPERRDASAREPVKPRAKDDQTDLRERIYRGQRPGRPDFGFSETNPVITASPRHSEKYLALLRTEEGEPFNWVREDTVSVRDLNRAGTANVEVFLLYLKGREYGRLYICPFGRNSSGVPRGMKLSTEGAALYGGSLKAEAEAKGISVEQVLQKQALVAGAAEPAEKDPPAEEAPEEQTAERARTAAALDIGPKTEETESSASGFPKYLPGFEPDNVRPSLEKFLAVMDRAYPDGVVKGSTWDHDRWDRAAAMLCRYLGYKNGTEFLEAYGYTVVK